MLMPGLKSAWRHLSSSLYYLLQCINKLFRNGKIRLIRFWFPQLYSKGENLSFPVNLVTTTYVISELKGDRDCVNETTPQVAWED